MLLYFDFNVELPMKFMEDWAYDHDHFTYANILVYVVEIIDAMSFASYNLIKVDAFYAKLNTMTYPCY